MTLAVCFSALLSTNCRAADTSHADAEKIVAQTMAPVMERYGVPGMAIGIVMNKWNRVYNYGVASKATGTPVTGDTLFEIGSVSKTFTATLACYAQLSGRMSLCENVSKYLPSLRGSGFDNVSLLNLGTHTSGGLPLQVPENIRNDDQLMEYLRQWKPIYFPGTYRIYSNVGIGMLGVIAARSMDGDFEKLMEDKLFYELGMKHTYFNVPDAQSDNYAEGYTKTDAPVRMSPGVLASEAYGIRATAGDMLRFVQANMRMLDHNDMLQGAITGTHTGYYRVGAMTQDLAWEQYHYPVDMKDLLAGNSDKVIEKANRASEINPPLPPDDDVLINKTGSTNGFAAYVAFIPARKIGIVLLANKNFPVEARVTAAYTILTQLQNFASSN